MKNAEEHKQKATIAEGKAKASASGFLLCNPLPKTEEYMIFTNNHVIMTQTEAQSATVELLYHDDKKKAPITYRISK